MVAAGFVTTWRKVQLTNVSFLVTELSNLKLDNSEFVTPFLNWDKNWDVNVSSECDDQTDSFKIQHYKEES